MNSPGLRLVRPLKDVLLIPEALFDISIRPLKLDTEAVQARALLNSAYRNGEGECLDAEHWREALQSDPEFESDLCLGAFNPHSGALSGVLQAWSTGFIKDLAVDSPSRKKGVGSALVADLSERLRARGLKQISLKVVPGIMGAIAFYEALGFEHHDATS